MWEMQRIFAIYFNGMLISAPKALNCLAHMIIDFSSSLPSGKTDKMAFAIIFYAQF